MLSINSGGCISLKLLLHDVAEVVSVDLNPYQTAVLELKGDEKSMFRYGGSTVVMLTTAGAVEYDSRFVEASAAGEETPVKIGERVAVAVR